MSGKYDKNMKTPFYFSLCMYFHGTLQLELLVLQIIIKDKTYAVIEGNLKEKHTDEFRYLRKCLNRTLIFAGLGFFFN